MRPVTFAALLLLLGCAPAKDKPPAEAPVPINTGPAPAEGASAEPEQATGRLPPEEIQRVMRASFDTYRACFEAGLARNPELTGRIELRFVIGTDGTVSDVRDEGDMPDEEVVGCVVAAVGTLTFPTPEGGVVTVSYPIVFSPAEGPPPEVKEAGRLEPALIQQVVRQNFASFRTCYERGLANNPDLEGRVMVKFVIGIDGKVTSATGSGDLPDKDVVACVAKEMQAVTFPKPAGGVVTVNYPIVFSSN